MNEPPYRWYRDLTRYHWFVLAVCGLGWLFDTMDQQLFVLARNGAMTELLAGVPLPEGTTFKTFAFEHAGYATSIFLIGWAAGGLIFGVLGDRIGRAKTMLLTILIYSFFTGLSAFSRNFTDFVIYRFLTGLGVGGEFAVGVALVAEVMPARARPYALGLLQALSTIGNITAAVVSLSLGHLQQTGALDDLQIAGVALKPWRIMFLVGVLPSLLAIVIRRRLKEPERWQQAVATEKGTARAGSYVELFGNPRWRHRAIVGLLLSATGVIGLWGILFFFPELVGSAIRKGLADSGLAQTQIDGEVVWWTSIASILVNAGGFLGMYSYPYLAQVTSRRAAFFMSLLATMICTSLVFWNLHTKSDYWMLFIMGYCQFTVFGGLAVYLPELFPTHLRSTGTSFCYNVGRIVAAVGPTILGKLQSGVFSSYPEPMRPAAIAMCSVFLVGLLTLPFAPETKDQPLPE